jgi:large subunit ribosomal protein L4
VVFGPKPRDYSKKINAKVKQLAFSRALFDRASAGEIAVIEAFDSQVSKTKAINAVVTLIAPKGKVLLVDAPFAAQTSRASRNLERVSLQDASKLNTLDLAQYAKIIVSTKALEAIIARANGGKN